MYEIEFANTRPALFAALGLCALAACAGFSIVLYVRSGRRRAVLAQEALRLAAVAALALTAMGPELVRTVHREGRPALAVLTDVSGSMDTCDILPPSPSAPSAADSPRLPVGPESRRSWADRLPESVPDAWEALRRRYNVVNIPFAAIPRPAADAPSLLASTDIAAAFSAAEAVPGLEAVLLLSDGQWNRGGPPSAAAERLGARRVPVFAIAVGEDSALPDLAILKVNAPAAVLLGDFVSLQCLVSNRMKTRAAGELSLRVDSLRVAARAPIDLAPGAEAWTPVVWEPDAEGEYQLTLSLPCPESDVDAGNNTATATVAVRKASLKVLVVEGEPRWEYRFLRNALIRDPGADADCLLLHPALGAPASGKGYLDAFPPKEKLMEYDVIFIGDVDADGAAFTLDDARSVAEAVEIGGAGAVLMPGPAGRLAALLGKSPPLAALCPVVLDSGAPEGVGEAAPMQTRLTFAGAKHLLTRLTGDERENEEVWRRLPGFHWRAAVSQVKGDAETLASADSGAEAKGALAPLIVARAAGEGLALFMGTDNAWRWRKGVEDLRHYRFWAQVIRCMARKRHMARSSLGSLAISPEPPEALREAAVTAALADAQGFPLRGASPVLAVRPPGGGAAMRIPMAELPGGWGVYKAAFTPEAPGTHGVEVLVRRGGAADAPALSAQVEVAGSTAERIGEPVNTPCLAEVAAAASGRHAGYREAGSLLSAIAGLPERKPDREVFRLWCAWWWTLATAILLMAYWTLRKRTGLP